MNRDITKYLNIKCVLFTIYMSILYWFLPRTKVNLVLITIINYILVNIYNNLYKCKKRSIVNNILITIIITFLLSVLPVKNRFILVLFLYFPYFILAWYDYFMNCSFRMNPTIFPYGRYIYLPIKPPSYKKKFEEIDPVVLENIKNFDKFLTTSIIIFVFIFVVLKFVK
jgi:hypothetical protein